MAKSVNQAFNEFNTNVVNLDPERTKVGRKSKSWLIDQLNQFDSRDNSDFPFMSKLRHIDFGSFARKTKIRELDDIDLIFCLHANGATYSKNANKYTVYTPNAGFRLKALSNENVLSSIKVLNKFKSKLSDIPQYSKSELHRVGEAVSLNLSSYEWSFDIVPAFYTDTGLYVIPDGSGNWKGTDPRIDQECVTNTNKRNKNMVLQLIRTLKYWNRYNSSSTINSYLFENFVINYSNYTGNFSNYLDFEIRDFFHFYKSAIYNAVSDPQGFQNDLNYLSYDQRVSISQSAERAYNIAISAIKHETTDKDQLKSIGKWRVLFGNKFPNYE